MISKRRVVHAVILFLLALNLAFIFVQSALPKEESKATSDKVSDMVADVVPPETKPGEFLQINIRKIAHFIEFFSLGMLSSVYVVFLGIKYRNVTASLLCAPLVALFDETLQIFSGRGSSVKDVWIDTAGFYTAAVIFYTGYLITKIIYEKVKNSSQS